MRNIESVSVISLWTIGDEKLGQKWIGKANQRRFPRAGSQTQSSYRCSRHSYQLPLAKTTQGAVDSGRRTTDAAPSPNWRLVCRQIKSAALQGRGGVSRRWGREETIVAGPSPLPGDQSEAGTAERPASLLPPFPFSSSLRLDQRSPPKTFCFLRRIPRSRRRVPESTPSSQTHLDRSPIPDLVRPQPPHNALIARRSAPTVGRRSQSVYSLFGASVNFKTLVKNDTLLAQR